MTIVTSGSFILLLAGPAAGGCTQRYGLVPLAATPLTELPNVEATLQNVNSSVVVLTIVVSPSDDIPNVAVVSMQYGETQIVWADYANTDMRNAGNERLCWDLTGVSAVYQPFFYISSLDGGSPLRKNKPFVLQPVPVPSGPPPMPPPLPSPIPDYTTFINSSTIYITHGYVPSSVLATAREVTFGNYRTLGDAQTAIEYASAVVPYRAAFSKFNPCYWYFYDTYPVPTESRFSDCCLAGCGCSACC